MAKVGRPSSYKPEYVVQAAKLCQLGATDVELADFFCVATATIKRWQADHDEFRAALKLSKSTADERVEKSLYHRALGYTFDAVKIFKNKGEEASKVNYREHMPPDTTACIFWLKNRRPDVWRDAHRHEHTGMFDLAQLSDDDLTAFEALARKAAVAASDPSRVGETQH